MNNPEAAMDEINLDTLLSADNFLAELDVGEYGDLADFITSVTSSAIIHPMTVGEPSSSKRSKGNPSTKILSKHVGETGKSQAPTPTYTMDKKVAKLKNPRGGKNISSGELKFAGKRKCNEVHNDYSVSTTRGEAYSLFSSKALRDDLLHGENFTTAMANKVRARMAFLAEESSGISPSMTFHPYMTLPEEVSMQRIGRHFPLLDLISSTTTVAQDSHPVPGASLAALLKQLTKISTSSSRSVDDTSNYAILQLFQQYLGISNDVLPNNNVSLKAGAYAGSNIASVARAVDEVNRGNITQLVFELEDTWRLTQRQCMFFKQNLSNLSRWCEKHFTPEMNASLFSADKVDSTLHEQLSSVHSNTGAYAYATAIGASVDSLVTFYSPLSNRNIYCQSDPCKLLFVRVKMKDTSRENYARIFAVLQPEDAVKWNGNKPELRQRLLNNIPKKGENVSVNGQYKNMGKQNVNTSIPSNKKANSFIAPQNMTSSDSLNFFLKPSYSQFTNFSQTENISSALSETAGEMEKLIIERIKKRKLDEDRLANKFASSESLTSSELWNALHQQGIFGNVPPSNMKELLRPAWNPELPAREIFWNEVSPPIIKSEFQSEMESFTKINPSSLYHRLQSLLVEENSDECTNINDALPKVDNHKSLEEANAIVDDEVAEDDDILDASGLTIDQRAYIHLRSSNLIDRSILSASPKIIDDPASFEYQKADCVDLDDTIRKMQMDLSRKHRVNNETASYLLGEAKKELSCTVKTEQSNVIENYSQLLKKQRESKKTNRINGDLPW